MFKIFDILFLSGFVEQDLGTRQTTFLTYFFFPSKKPFEAC